MKHSLFIFLISLILSLKGAAETNLVSTRTYSLLSTNWDWHTNTFDVFFGSNGKTNGVYTVNRGRDAQIGTVMSNQFCDIFYDEHKIRTVLLFSNVVGKIEITWETNVVYKTNFHRNKTRVSEINGDVIFID